MKQEKIADLGNTPSKKFVTMNEALLTLTPLTKLVFVLSTSEGLSTSEIATRLGISEKDVRVKRHNALQRIHWIQTHHFLEASSNQIMSSQADSYQPPKVATFLLCLFLSKTDLDNIIGDLDEQFPKWVERHGLRMARFLYLKDACTTIYPTVQKLWWRIFKLLAKVGGIAGLAEVIRHIRFW